MRWQKATTDTRPSSMKYRGVSTRNDDRGQASMMLIAVFTIMALVVITSSLIARRAVERSLARNGADAIALSAVVGDENAPFMVAASNGIEDFVIDEHGSRATVSVTVGDMEAKATAQRVGGPLAEAPAMAAVMARLSQLSGRDIGYSVVVPDPYLAVGEPSFTVEVDLDMVASVLEQAEVLALCRPDVATHPTRFRMC